MSKIQDKSRVKVRKKVESTDIFSVRIAEIKKTTTDTKKIEKDLRDAYFNEAMRYIDNAKETLKKAKMDGQFYLDAKYIKTACGTAYSGVLIAMDGYFYSRGLEIKPKETKDVDFYRYHASKFDKKLLNLFNSAYEILHLWGYYDGITDSVIVKRGFEHAKKITYLLKPTE
ncbi:MAG: DUF5618 family protein [Bacteroidales bacterium]|jgi:hypothetical protein|nr:DUF5618 family protein [Bacteroidales bacterium]